MTINERLHQLIDETNLKTQRAFAQEVGVSTSTLNVSLKKDKEPATGMILKIKQKFQNLNLNWLLIGEGEMWLPEEGDIASMPVAGLEYQYNISDLRSCADLLREKDKRIEQLLGTLAAAERDKSELQKDKEQLQKDKEFLQSLIRQNSH